jgi:hypothetical protein
MPMVKFSDVNIVVIRLGMQIDKFTKDIALTYSKSMEEKYKENVDNIASNIIKYISSRYESKVKSAIDKNYNCKAIEISLPRLYHPKKIGDNAFREVNSMVSKHFSLLGFSVSLNEGTYCNCIFDRVCNMGNFYAILDWS